MDPNTNSIPEEILFEILTMLPVKSLCRFRCVSKRWFSIISDSNLIATHLSRSKSRPKLLISVTRGVQFYRADSTSFYSIEYPEEDDESSILHATTHHGSIEVPFTLVGISASESGLICCTCHQGIKIGNPITGEFDLIQYPSGSNEYYKEYSRLNLGFDPIDERLVMLKLEENDYHVKTSLFPLLKRQWHDTHHQPYIIKSAICMNGFIYFTALHRQSLHSQFEEYLYAFNVKLESFELIQLPPSLPFTLDDQLIEYKGCVALVFAGFDVSTYDPPTEDNIKLWILEDPKKHTWSFKSIVVPWRDTHNLWRWKGNSWERMRKFVGFSHKGELMFATQLSTTASIDLFLFDIDTNTVRAFQVDGFLQFHHLQK